MSVLKAVKERPEDTILKCFTKETFRVMIYPSITYSLVPEESLYIYKYTFISTSILLNKIWMSQLYVSAIQNLTYHLVLALLTI